MKTVFTDRTAKVIAEIRTRTFMMQGMMNCAGKVTQTVSLMRTMKATMRAIIRVILIDVRPKERSKDA